MSVRGCCHNLKHATDIWRQQKILAKMSSRVEFCSFQQNKIKPLVIYVDSEKKSNVRQFEIDFFFFGTSRCAKLVRQPSEIRSTYLVSQPVQSPQQSCPKAPHTGPVEMGKRDSMADPSQVDGIAFNGPKPNRTETNRAAPILPRH